MADVADHFELSSLSTPSTVQFQLKRSTCQILFRLACITSRIIPCRTLQAISDRPAGDLSFRPFSVHLRANVTHNPLESEIDPPLPGRMIQPLPSKGCTWSLKSRFDYSGAVESYSMADFSAAASDRHRYLT